MRTLQEIGKECGTDKAGPHSYLPLYEQLLAHLMGPQNVALVEIGVLEGRSLEMWRQWFTERKPVGHVTILGFDNDPRCRWKEITKEPVCFRDATSRVEVDRVFDDGGLDVVIDDGSHKVEDQILSMCWFWPKLKQGGLYIIEDIQPGMDKWFGSLLNGMIFDRRLLGISDDVLFVARKP